MAELNNPSNISLLDRSDLLFDPSANDPANDLGLVSKSPQDYGSEAIAPTEVAPYLGDSTDLPIITKGSEIALFNDPYSDRGLISDIDLGINGDSQPQSLLAEEPADTLTGTVNINDGENLPDEDILTNPDQPTNIAELADNLGYKSWLETDNLSTEMLPTPVIDMGGETADNLPAGFSPTNVDNSPNESVNMGGEPADNSPKSDGVLTNTNNSTNHTTNQSLPTISETFTSGTFTVGSDGQVGIDFLYDGGWYQGQLAIFSLEGMEQYQPGSAEFIKEAARRALSNSELGYIVIDDVTEGARFSGFLGESSPNKGEYKSVKSFAMNPGSIFGVMLIPNGQVAEVAENPGIGGNKRPLFSMVTANPNQGFHLGQIADVTGEGNTFVLEDLRVDQGSDRDYNDIIFQVRGAVGTAIHLDQVINPNKDWRNLPLGKELIQ